MTDDVIPQVDDAIFLVKNNFCSFAQMFVIISKHDDWRSIFIFNGYLITSSWWCHVFSEKQFLFFCSGVRYHFEA